MHKQLGRYEIVRVIGKGTVGLVYEALDPVLSRRVAIKVIFLDRVDRDEWEDRFRREALAAARLDHPNIVAIHDFGSAEGIAYLVMRLYEGDDLQQLLDKGVRFSNVQAVSLVLDVLSALDHAHDNGVVHREVKPASIIVEDGRALLMNFGVAPTEVFAPNVTQPIRAPKSMSPEQVRRHAPDARSDLWSTAVVLYELLCGTHPFGGDDPFSTMRRIVEDAPTPPSQVRPGLPPGLDAFMAKALAKDPAGRFQTAREFAIALKAAGRPAPAGAPAVPSVPRSAPAPVSSAISLELELEFWKDIKESDDTGLFEDFLHQFPQGKFAHLARRRLALLRGESTPGGEAIEVLQTGPTTNAARARGDQARLRDAALAPQLGDEGGPELPGGATVRDLLVRQHLNSGGFGIVYTAHDPGLDLEVALKEYLPRTLAHRDRAGQVRPYRDSQSIELFRKGLDSFLNEGRLLARVDHPALAKVHQAFQANSTGYLVMKLYRGHTLKETLRRDPAVATEDWLRALLRRVAGATPPTAGRRWRPRCACAWIRRCRWRSRRRSAFRRLSWPRSTGGCRSCRPTGRKAWPTCWQASATEAQGSP